MANTLPSANMGLPVPVAGVDPGPDYALNVNNALTLIDGHDHSAGKGVPVTPDGLNISSDLSFLNNNLINARSIRFQPQVAPLGLGTDVGCLYEAGVDLYYNDGAGNQVRITQSGGVAGSPGSIANLTAPASATYVSGSETFVWQSAANKPANLDAAFIILRNNSVSSFGLSLKPPTAMGSNYTITLPPLPGVTNIMSMDVSGNMGALINVDNSTLQLTSNTLAIKPKGVTQGLLADRATGTTVAAGGVAVSASSGLFSTANSSFTAITNLSVTITTTGRPVMVFLIPDGSGSTNDALLSVSILTSPRPVQQLAVVQIKRDSTDIYQSSFSVIQAAGGLVDGMGCAVTVSSIQTLDMPTAGTYTYSVSALVPVGQLQFTCEWAKLVAYEI